MKKSLEQLIQEVEVYKIYPNINDYKKIIQDIKDSGFEERFSLKGSGINFLGRSFEYDLSPILKAESFELSDKEIRLKCLEIASTISKSTQSIIEAASRFEDFINTGK